MDTIMALDDASMAELYCLAFRHRWVPKAGTVGVVGGAKCIQWLLTCEDGCDSTAVEWRDMFGIRIPGTQRQYNLTDSYRKATGYSQGEYVMEIHNRQAAARRSMNRRKPHAC